MTTHSQDQRRHAGNARYVEVPFYRGLLKLPVVLWRLGLGRVLPLSILTATGRSSGLPRRTALYPHDLDGRTYLWCPYGSHAQWYRNVLAGPVVTLQSRRGSRVLRASTLTDERETLRLVTELRRFGGSFFETYLDGEGLTGTDEELARSPERLHLLRLDPTTEPGPPALRADLGWVWLVVAAALALVVWAVVG